MQTYGFILNHFLMLNNSWCYHSVLNKKQKVKTKKMTTFIFTNVFHLPMCIYNIVADFLHRKMSIWKICDSKYESENIEAAYKKTIIHLITESSTFRIRFILHKKFAEHYLSVNIKTEFQLDLAFMPVHFTTMENIIHVRLITKKFEANGDLNRNGKRVSWSWSFG